MSYPDEKYYIAFFFQRYKDFEKSTKCNQTEGPGRPKMHSDSSLIVFFAFMELKGINKFKAQSSFFWQIKIGLKRCEFRSVPARTTLISSL